MTRTSRRFRNRSALAAFAVAASVLTPAVWAGTDGDTVTVRAAALQAKADYHAQRAAFYRERATPDSKQMITYFTLANRCDRLASHYRRAAAEEGHRG